MKSLYLSHSNDISLYRNISQYTLFSFTNTKYTVEYEQENVRNKNQNHNIRKILYSKRKPFSVWLKYKRRKEKSILFFLSSFCHRIWNNFFFLNCVSYELKCVWGFDSIQEIYLKFNIVKCVWFVNWCSLSLSLYTHSIQLKKE